MPNLLDHTIEILHHNKKSVRDILYCQTDEGWFDWKDFIDLANINYNRIGSFINPTLQIIGKDFVMEWSVDENDQEWWFIDFAFDKPLKNYKPKTLKIEEV